MGRFSVYTDGASSKNGHGGWAWWQDDRVWDSGNSTETTNQRMELTAVLMAMDHYYDADPVLIISDSAYVVNCFTDRWFDKWLTNNWKNGKIKNRDLWEIGIELYVGNEEHFNFKHVRGHSGIIGNERADQLAVAAKLRLL